MQVIRESLAEKVDLVLTNTSYNAQCLSNKKIYD